MNSSESRFVHRVSSNPSLYKHCSMVWRDRWSREEQLQQVVQLTFSASASAGGINEPSSSIKLSCVQLFLSVPLAKRTPAKFNTFLTTFITLLKSKKSTIQTRFRRLRTGVDKLTETSELI